MSEPLDSVQRRFLRAITAQGDELSELLRADTRDALRIYQDSFFFRGLGALKGGFPHCLALCGKERFTALATRFLAELPATEGLLLALANDFVGVLERAGHELGRADLGALATLERALQHAEPGPPVWLELPHDASLLCTQLGQGIAGAVSPPGRYFIAVGADASGPRHALANEAVAGVLRAGGVSDAARAWLERHPWAGR